MPGSSDLQVYSNENFDNLSDDMSLKRNASRENNMNVPEMAPVYGLNRNLGSEMRAIIEQDSSGKQDTRSRELGTGITDPDRNSDNGKSSLFIERPSWLSHASHAGNLDRPQQFEDSSRNINIIHDVKIVQNPRGLRENLGQTFGVRNSSTPNNPYGNFRTKIGDSSKLSHRELLETANSIKIVERGDSGAPHVTIDLMKVAKTPRVTLGLVDLSTGTDLLDQNLVPHNSKTSKIARYSMREAIDKNSGKAIQGDRENYNFPRAGPVNYEGITQYGSRRDIGRTSLENGDEYFNTRDRSGDIADPIRNNLASGKVSMYEEHSNININKEFFIGG